METKDEVSARDILHVINDLLVALAPGDPLVLPVREWVGAHRRDGRAAVLSVPNDHSSQATDVSSNICDVPAHRSGHLDHALVQLGLEHEVLADGTTPLCHAYQRMNVGLEPASLWIDDRVLFLNTESVLVLTHCFSSPYCSDTGSERDRSREAIFMPHRRDIYVLSASPPR